MLLINSYANVAVSTKQKTIIGLFQPSSRRHKRATRRIDPELRLWYAVLNSAVQDATVHRSTKDGKTAWRWINNNSTDDYTFLWVCNHVEFKHVEELRSLVNFGTEEDFERVRKELFRT